MFIFILFFKKTLLLKFSIPCSWPIFMSTIWSVFSLHNEEKFIVFLNKFTLMFDFLKMLKLKRNLVIYLYNLATSKMVIFMHISLIKYKTTKKYENIFLKTIILIF